MSFLGCENDAIDISGSEVYFQNVYIDSVGDKGVSAGEKSTFFGDGIIIKNSAIGLCSKDNSLIDASGISIKNNKVGCVIFQKKSEFGPGLMQLKGVEMDNVEIPHLIENKSFFTIDGNKVSFKNNEKVKNLLYGVKYGKKSI